MALRYVADKSALARLKQLSVSARLAPLILGGDVATCSVVELEVLFSARSHADLAKTRRIRKSLPRVDLSQVDFDRAEDVLEALESVDSFWMGLVLKSCLDENLA
ncbi:MAG: hypothetical protein H6717_05850 [Polyangiaceae bacterium]|nr:hypothetical protein [Polyangiaceae bacterium]